MVGNWGIFGGVKSWVGIWMEWRNVREEWGSVLWCGGGEGRRRKCGEVWGRCGRVYEVSVEVAKNWWKVCWDVWRSVWGGAEKCGGSPHTHLHLPHTSPHTLHTHPIPPSTPTTLTQHLSPHSPETSFHTFPHSPHTSPHSFTLPKPLTPSLTSPHTQGWKLKPKPKPENPVLQKILETQAETDTYLAKILKT